MRVRFSVLSVLPVVLAALGAAGAESLGERYLVEMRVRAAADCRFVSFLPARPQARVWAPDRIGPWKRRVAGLVRLPDGSALRVADVRPQPFDEPFDAIPVRDSFRSFLAAGQEGVEALPFANGSIRTNRFRIVNLPEEEATAQLQWQGGKEGFVLRAWQGASQQIWFVDWDDLSERWSGMLSRRASEVRDEMEVIRTSGRLSAEGGGTWRKRLDGFLATHPAIWPGIVFTNAMDVDVKVSCAGESRPLAPGAVWLKKVTASIGEGDGIPWSFVRTDGGERPEEFNFDSIPWRMDVKYDIPVVIQPSAAKSKGAPRLAIDNRLIPSAEILQNLGENQPAIRVVYADGTNSSPLAVLESFGHRYVEVDPHRRIRAFEIECDFCEKATLKSKKDSYLRGENVGLDGGLTLKPWPLLTVENRVADRVVTNTVTFHVPGETTPLAGSSPLTIVLQPGGKRQMRPDPGVGGDRRVGLEVRVASAAAYATPSSLTIGKDRFHRGASGVTCAPELECRAIPPPPKPPEKPHMPGDNTKEWRQIGSKIMGALADIAQYDSLPVGRDKMRRLIEEELTSNPDNVIKAVCRHLESCPGGCSECRAFREHLGALNASAGNPTEKQVLLASFRGYLVERRRLSAAEAQAEVDNLSDYLATLPDNWMGK